MSPDPYKYFRVEARELVDQLGTAVLELEKGPAPELAARFLRLAHTLKGAARVVRQREIADQAHAIEEALMPFRESTARVPRHDIDAVLRHLDDISGRVTALGLPAGADEAAASHSRPEELFRTVRADMAEMDALLDGIAETRAQVGSLGRSLAAVERTRHLVEVVADQLTRPRTRTRYSEDGTPRGEGRSMAELRSAVGGLERNLSSGLAHIDRELRQTRDAGERLRLVPAGALFTTLERTARDAALALGRRVVFEGRGVDVRLEAQVLGEVQSALVQIVRNAVAHGIEPENERTAAGKPTEGRVTLDVTRRGRHVAFTCVDDGRGVDLDAIRSALERKGLLSAEAQALGAEDVLHLLLKGGISTSGTVTEVSGRGIGLDVVREIAERLGGEVRVRTQAGKGTTVDLVVPVSLASVEVLVVEASRATALIPFEAVQRTLRIAPDDVIRTPNGEAIVYEGKTIPFVLLSNALSVKRQPARGPGPWSAVVVRSGNQTAAVGVDRLLGTINAVLRPLPALVPSAAIVAGASLDADGKPQLVLDPDALIVAASRSAPPEVAEAVSRAPILVIDDSLTTRMLEQSILESAFYEVDVATSGEEALEKARGRRYALFLVDVEMPGMDGFTFIESARADRRLCDIPAILVTSRASPEDRRRGEEAGARGYIVKSEFNQHELLERIRTLVQ